MPNAIEVIRGYTEVCDKVRAPARSFVEFNGKDVLSVKTAFKHAVELAKLLGNVTAHTLRHTAATWLMQAGVDPWQAAGYLGMSVETLLRVYGRHHPDHLADAVEGITRKPKGERSKTVGSKSDLIGGGRSPSRAHLRCQIPC